MGVGGGGGEVGGRGVRFQLPRKGHKLVKELPLYCYTATAVTTATTGTALQLCSFSCNEQLHYN